MSKTFSLQENLSTLNTEECTRAQKRLLLLKNTLSKLPWYEDDVRDDSRLAWMFATNEDIDVDDVAHEMAAVHYMHQSSKYPTVVQERLREAAAILKESYPTVPWKIVWKYVSKFGVPVVKYSCTVPDVTTSCSTEEQNENE
jgi:hypothetical protein